MTNNQLKTFNELKNKLDDLAISYIEGVALLDDDVSEMVRGIYHVVREIICQQHGWTHKEYMDELYRRYDESINKNNKV